MRSKRIPGLAAVVALGLLGFGLRVYHLDAVALRGDEAFTVIHWMREPLAATLANIATVDPHPPLAYALFRGWALVMGTGEFQARVLPALLNLIGIPALYALGRRLGGERVGLLAALLWTLHPFQIWHAQDARNYAIWGAFSPLAVWLALCALDRRRPRDWLLYIAGAALAAYVYYLELFALAALNVYVLLVHHRDRPLLLRWLGAQVAVGLLLAPWYVQERLLFGSGYGGTTGGFQPAAWLTTFLPTLTFGQTLPPALDTWLWLILLPLLIAGAGVLWRRAGRRTLLPLLLGTLPLLLIGLVSLRLNVFQPRYVLSAAPAYTVLFAALVVGLAHTMPRTMPARAVPAALVALWIGLSAYSLYNYYAVPAYAKSPDLRTLLAFFRDHARPDDIVIQKAADESFNYYYDLYGVPADRKQLPANPTQSTDEITRLLDADRDTHYSLWTVLQTFPDWPSYGVVENWIDELMQPVRRVVIDGRPVEQFMPWEVRPAELPPNPLARFDSMVELANAVIIEPTPLDNTLTVWLYWRAGAPTAVDLKGFVHLVGPINPASGSPLWAQDDQFPQDGRTATTTWQTGTVFRDVYTLPLDGVLPGTYTVIAGLYDPTTGQRLPVDGSDHTVIGNLTVP